MKHLMLILSLVATPVAAQEADPGGRDLMAEALRLFMRGLMEEMEPAFDDLNTLLDNIDVYHPPEMLPNGDIIIRRRIPIDRHSEDGEIDL